MKHLQRFWSDWTYLRQSRAWLLANQNSTLPLDAMFHLNHAAKTQTFTPRAVIYGLKNELVRLLYAKGYCISATQERQVFECWDCGGTGDDGWSEGSCSKCDGTGVYREYRLIRFVFQYKGQRYVWHQPSQYVDWPVEFTDGEIRQFKGDSHAASVHLTNSFYNIYIGTVYAFLRLNGVPKSRLPKWFNLWSAIKDEWMETHQYYVYRRFRRRVQNFIWDVQNVGRNGKRLWSYLQHGELPVVEVIDDDIPF